MPSVIRATERVAKEIEEALFLRESTLAFDVTWDVGFIGLPQQGPDGGVSMMAALLIGMACPSPILGQNINLTAMVQDPYSYQEGAIDGMVNSMLNAMSEKHQQALVPTDQVPAHLTKSGLALPGS